MRSKAAFLCGSRPERSNALADAFMEVAGDRGIINARMLGRWIEKQAGRHCEGMWFQKAGIRSGNNVWKVKGQPTAERDLEEVE